MAMMAMSLRLAVDSVVLNPWKDLGFLEYKPSVDQVRSQVQHSSFRAMVQRCWLRGAHRCPSAAIVEHTPIEFVVCV